MLKTAEEFNERLGREPPRWLEPAPPATTASARFYSQLSQHLPSEGLQSRQTPLSRCKGPLASSLRLWVTYQRRSGRNTREIRSYPRLLWWDNSFWICIKFHLMPPISVGSFFPPATEVLSTVPLTSRPFSDVPKCLHGHSIR